MPFNCRSDRSGHPAAAKSRDQLVGQRKQSLCLLILQWKVSELLNLKSTPAATAQPEEGESTEPAIQGKCGELTQRPRVISGSVVVSNFYKKAPLFPKSHG